MLHKSVKKTIKRRPLTDTGNAERLVDLYGEEIRFCKGIGYLVNDGKKGVWKREDKGQIGQYIKLTVRSIEKEADYLLAKAVGKSKEEKEAAEKVAESIQSHAHYSESKRSREAVEKLAQSEPRIAITVDQLDRDPWLFNVLNGTINLRTGRHRRHDPKDLITKQALFNYDSKSPCPLWDKFLTKVQPDKEVRTFLQRWVGYCITGVIRDHHLPINYGLGRNGKGVFIDTLLYMMGDYAKQVTAEVLLAKKYDAHPTERADLFGCRFAAASEPPQGAELNVALVKLLTGGDRIRARFMRKDFFEFEPSHKLMLSTNHQPVIKETTNAIWERLLLIPWTVTIPAEERDPELKEKLKAEAPGILRWAVEGCLAWQKEGLNPPDAIRFATADYREDQNNVCAFIEDECERVAGTNVGTVEMYENYEEWCTTSSETPLTPNDFRDALTGMGIRKGKSNGRMVYHGIRLKLRACQPHKIVTGPITVTHAAQVQ